MRLKMKKSEASKSEVAQGVGGSGLEKKTAPYCARALVEIGRLEATASSQCVMSVIKTRDRHLSHLTSEERLARGEKEQAGSCAQSERREKGERKERKVTG